jgi:hypothetical protein
MDSVLCPVSAYREMCHLIPAPSSSPAFCLPCDKRFRSLSYYQFQKCFKKLIVKTGRDATRYSSHSFWRGGANWAFKSNVPSDLIQKHGDWKSDAYKKYLEFDFEQRGLVAKCMNQKVIGM